MADEQLLSLRDDVALLESRQITLLQKLSDNPPPLWKDLADAMQCLQAADTAEETENALRRMEELIQVGCGAVRIQREVWEEVREVTQEKTKTAAAEWKRLHELQAVLTVEQAMLLVHTIMAAAKEIVTDRAQLQKLYERTAILLPPEGS